MGMNKQCDDHQLSLWYTPRLDPPLPEYWGLNDQSRTELEELLWEMLLHGASTPEAYVEVFDYILPDENAGLGEKYREEITEYAQQLINARRAYAAAIGLEPRNNDLTLAFDALAHEGVVARECFTCCGSCGSAEIWDERDDSRTWYGYVFYHEQDAESAYESGSVGLNYGVFLDAYFTEQQWDALDAQTQEQQYESLSVKLLREKVLPVFEQHGLWVDWEGSYSVRPQVFSSQFSHIP